MKNMIVMLTLLISSTSFSNTLELQPGEYVYTDSSQDFNVGKNGITLEVWIYLNQMPSDRLHEKNPNGTWMILGKPGSYYITIKGRNLEDPSDAKRPQGVAMIDYGGEIERGHDRWGTSVRSSGIAPNSHRRWWHVALQIVPMQDVDDLFTFHTYFNDQWAGSSNFNWVGFTNAPLIIGGSSPDWGRGAWRHTTTMNGRIDEVRISSGLLYPVAPAGRLNTIRPLENLKTTVALWHFKEGPDSHSYTDSSGNGYTLLRARSNTSVGSRSKLVTTWAQIKIQLPISTQIYLLLFLSYTNRNSGFNRLL